MFSPSLFFFFPLFEMEVTQSATWGAGGTSLLLDFFFLAYSPVSLTISNCVTYFVLFFIAFLGLYINCAVKRINKVNKKFSLYLTCLPCYFLFFQNLSSTNRVCVCVRNLTLCPSVRLSVYAFITDI